MQCNGHQLYPQHTDYPYGTRQLGVSGSGHEPTFKGARGRERPCFRNSKVPLSVWLVGPQGTIFETLPICRSFSTRLVVEPTLTSTYQLTTDIPIPFLLDKAWDMAPLHISKTTSIEPTNIIIDDVKLTASTSFRKVCSSTHLILDT